MDGFVFCAMKLFFFWIVIIIFYEILISDLIRVENVFRALVASIRLHYI